MEPQSRRLGRLNFTFIPLSNKLFLANKCRTSYLYVTEYPKMVEIFTTLMMNR